MSRVDLTLRPTILLDLDSIIDNERIRPSGLRSLQMTKDEMAAFLATPEGIAAGVRSSMYRGFELVVSQD